MYVYQQKYSKYGRENHVGLKDVAIRDVDGTAINEELLDSWNN